MFARPYPTTASSAYRSTTSLPTPGGGSLDSTTARPHRLDARRDGYAERTVITSDGVRLAVRDYGSAGARGPHGRPAARSLSDSDELGTPSRPPGASVG